MLLYNVTVSLDPEVSAEWLIWMKEIHIPEVMQTGCFVNYRLCRMLNQAEDSGHTFAIQYLAASEEAYDTYLDKHAPILQKAHTDKYSGKFAAFRTLLEVIQTEDHAQ